MVEWKKFLVAGVGALFASFLWYVDLGLLLRPAEISWLFFVLLVGFGYFLYKRTSRARHAAGWSCVLLALGSFFIPISALFFSVSATAEIGKEGAAQAIGAGIGGAIITGIGMVVGLFFGIVFAVAAYFLLKNEGKSKKEEKK